MKKLVRALIAPALAAAILGCVFLLPKHDEMMESCISPDLPLESTLPGWWGIKVQESEKERSILAADTRFSKGQYTQPLRVPWERKKPAVEVSIVYSGQDMNNSIHRPERCLPAQGHMNLQGSESELTLANGRKLHLTRLTSRIPMPGNKNLRLNFIHYYVFFGHDSVSHTHLGRTLQDLIDRVVLGRVQRWAYFQAGTCWAPEIGISEQEADERLRKLISQLLPGQVDWQAL